MLVRDRPSRSLLPGGDQALTALGQALQGQWPDIRRDPQAWESASGSVPRPLHFVYERGSVEIELRLSFSQTITPETLVVYVVYYCQNPPDARSVYLGIIQWLMSQYDMKCSPGWPLVGNDSEGDDDCPLLSSFDEAKTVILRRLDRTERFWKDAFPEGCRRGVWPAHPGQLFDSTSSSR